MSLDPRELEQDLVAEKEWKMKGEVKASNRPVNSLLDAKLEFDTNIINVPITKDENVSIIRYITQRFREKTFDNYEFKEKVEKIEEEVYDIELVETNKEILELYERIEREIKALTKF